jgi:hypothetical protein
VQEYELELSIGDVLQVGDCTVTVIDIEGSEVSFRVDSQESEEMFVFNADASSRQPR